MELPQMDWKDQFGRKTPVSEMTDNHLSEAADLLLREFAVQKAVMAIALLAEMEKRRNFNKYNKCDVEWSHPNAQG